MNDIYEFEQFSSVSTIQLHNEYINIQKIIVQGLHKKLFSRVGGRIMVNWLSIGINIYIYIYSFIITFLLFQFFIIIFSFFL